MQARPIPDTSFTCGQDWEIERRSAVMGMVTPTLRHIHSHCQHQDQAFWPRVLSADTPSPYEAEATLPAEFNALGVVEW